MLTKSELLDLCATISFPGERILVLQSSFKGIGGFDGGPRGMIDTICDFLGPNGTLIMPAYNFHCWTEQHYFDVLETSSEVGAVTEVFRRMEGVGRTKHPIHSLSVLGKLRSELEEIDSVHSFGEDSVFARLLDGDAIYATIGLGEKMPFLPCHFAEARMRVPYRRQKDFAGVYLDSKRRARVAVYCFDVRQSELNPVYPAHEILCGSGDVVKVKKHGVDLFWSSGKKYHQDFVRVILSHSEMFCDKEVG